MMRLLLDTHILIWYLTEDARLSSTGMNLIDDPANEVFFSPISVWEIMLKHAAHPDNVSFTGKQFADLCIASGIAELNLNHKHVLAAERLQRDPLAKPHKDPFDRILLAQAKVEDLRFVSHDAMLPGYNEPCLLVV